MFYPTSEQLEVLKIKDGKNMVLAPAGCGKTAILTALMESQIRNGVAQDKLACFTFTNRAAAEMEGRIRERVPNHRVFVGNFHAFAVKYLKANNLIAQTASILDEESQNLLIQEIMAGTKSFKEQINLYLRQNATVNSYGKYEGEYNCPCGSLNQWNKPSLFRFCCGKSIPASGVETNDVKQIAKKLAMMEAGIEVKFHESIKPPEKIFGITPPIESIAKAYIRIKKENAYLDYEDLLIKLYQHLKSADQKGALEKFQFLIVDETQDLNPFQHAIIQLLTDVDSTLIYFADTNQAIYSFMGADISHILDLKRECEQSGKMYRFTINYRSPNYLLHIFNQYASKYFGELYIPSESYQGASQRDYVARVPGLAYSYIELLRKLVSKENEPYSMTAVLARSNRHAEEFAENLRNLGVSYFKVSGDDLFLRKEMKFLMAFFGTVNNEFDRFSWILLTYYLYASRKGSKNWSTSKTIKECRELINGIFASGVTPKDAIDFGFSGSRFACFKEAYANQSMVVFDTETTGIDTLNDDIIQIAAIKLRNGQEIDRYEVYMDTDKDLTESEKIHHISKSTLLERGIERVEGLKGFLHFIEGSAILAHNLNYDFDILNANLSRYLGEKYRLKADPTMQFDSLYLAKIVLPNLPQYKLESLIKHLELKDVVNSHNALDDVIATGKVIERLFELGQSIYLKVPSQVTQNAISRLKALYERFQPRLDKQMSLGVFAGIFFREMEVNRQILDDELYKFINHTRVYTDTKYDDLLTLESRITKYYHQYSTYSESDLLLGDERICISTVHKSKGLQFDNVVIPKFDEWGFDKEQDKKEERLRLLYVAMTRAKKRLYIDNLKELWPVDNQGMPVGTVHQVGNWD